MPRPQGSLNKVTKETREMLSEALQGHLINVKSALEELREKDPKAFLTAITALLPYITPRLKSINTDSEESQPAQIIIQPATPEVERFCRETLES